MEISYIEYRRQLSEVYGNIEGVLNYCRSGYTTILRYFHIILQGLPDSVRTQTSFIPEIMETSNQVYQIRSPLDIFIWIYSNA